MHEMHSFRSSVRQDQTLKVKGAHLVLALRCSFVSAATAFFAASLRFLISSKAAPRAAYSPCIAASACKRMYMSQGFQSTGTRSYPGHISICDFAKPGRPTPMGASSLPGLDPVLAFNRCASSC